MKFENEFVRILPCIVFLVAAFRVSNVADDAS